MIFLDASAIIYLIEGDSAVRSSTQRTLKSAVSEQFQPRLAVSALSVLECRVHPVRMDDQDRLARFDEFFDAPGLTMIDLNLDVIHHATLLRARFGLRTPDALQAACCFFLGGKTPFITGDADFRRLPDLNLRLVEL